MQVAAVGPVQDLSEGWRQRTIKANKYRPHLTNCDEEYNLMDVLHKFPGMSSRLAD